MEISEAQPTEPKPDMSVVCEATELKELLVILVIKLYMLYVENLS